MAKDFLIGNINNIAKKPSEILIGDSNNIAKAVKYIFIGNSSNQAVRVYPTHLIPSEYQECEYIYNVGATQYIDTGVYPNSDTRLQIVLKMVTASENGYFLGCANSTISNRMFYQAWDYDLPTPGTSFRYYIGTTYKALPYNSNINTIDINKEYNGVCYFNQTSFKFNDTFGNMGCTYLLFGYHSGSNVYLSSNKEYRIYSFKAWQYGSLIRNMYPCYLKSDSLDAGMYDVVGNQYHSNAGSGYFRKGPDVII